jgi:hypothetical protein
MGRLAVRIAAMIVLAACVGACDKCGDPAKLNAPWDSKTCYGESAGGK